VKTDDLPLLIETLRMASNKDECVARNYGEDGCDIGWACEAAAIELARLNAECNRWFERYEQRRHEPERGQADHIARMKAIGDEWAMKKRTEKEQCPVCGMRVGLDKNGRLFMHGGGKIKAGQFHCPGSERKPDELKKK